jgi:hypothetical protein
MGPTPQGFDHLKLDDLFGSKTVAFNNTLRDSPQEIRARLQREEADAAHQRAKDLFLYRTVTAAVGVVSVVCLIIAVIPAVPDDTRKWATTLLTSIVSAGLGYMTGKASK